MTSNLIDLKIKTCREGDKVIDKSWLNSNKKASIAIHKLGVIGKISNSMLDAAKSMYELDLKIVGVNDGRGRRGHGTVVFVLIDN